MKVFSSTFILLGPIGKVTLFSKIKLDHLDLILVFSSSTIILKSKFLTINWGSLNGSLVKYKVFDSQRLSKISILSDINLGFFTGLIFAFKELSERFFRKVSFSLCFCIIFPISKLDEESSLTSLILKSSSKLSVKEISFLSLFRNSDR